MNIHKCTYNELWLVHYDAQIDSKVLLFHSNQLLSHMHIMSNDIHNFSPCIQILQTYERGNS